MDARQGNKGSCCYRFLMRRGLSMRTRNRTEQMTPNTKPKFEHQKSVIAAGKRSCFEPGQTGNMHQHSMSHWKGLKPQLKLLALKNKLHYHFNVMLRRKGNVIHLKPKERIHRNALRLWLEKVRDLLKKPALLVCDQFLVHTRGNRRQVKH